MRNNDIQRSELNLPWGSSEFENQEFEKRTVIIAMIMILITTMVMSMQILFFMAIQGW